MAPTQAPDFVGQWDEAYKASVTQGPQVKAAYLLEHVGPRITAASLGLADARQVKRWATDPDTGPREHAVGMRLDALFRIVLAITPVYSAAVAARFLRSANPQLDDEAPLVALAAAGDARAVNRVVAATRAFLEG